MNKKITTIEGLAEMIQRAMASTEDMTEVKEDLKAMEGRLTTWMDGIDTRLDHLDARIGRIEADVHALRDAMVHRQEFQDALDRITDIEKKLGSESGV